MNTFQPLLGKQRDYFRTDVTKSHAWRIDQLSRLGRLIGEHEQAFRAALAADFKTVGFEQTMEIAGVQTAIAEAKDQLAQWMQPQPAELPGAFAAQGHRAVIRRDPYGVALVIAPFNAPVSLLFLPLIAVLAAGNTAIVKPAESTSAFADLMQDLVPAYFDAEAVAIVRGNREQVAELLDLPFDFIFFTGSTTVGRVVMRAAAEHLTPIVLELGGQNPAIVDESADLADAAEKLVWGAMAFGGQWCVSPGYVYVHESVAADFAEQAKAALTRLYGPEPAASPDLSRMITQDAVRRIAGLLESAPILAGGHTGVDSRLVEPTLVYPATWDMPVMREEIFGPVLPILTYRDLDDVIVTIKQRPTPLAAYVFSRDEERVERLLTALSFGSGAVNQTMVQTFFLTLPFGGVGASGMGQYFGRHGFDTLSHAKAVVIADPDSTRGPAWLPPYDATSEARFAAIFASS